MNSRPDVQTKETDLAVNAVSLIALMIKNKFVVLQDRKSVV